MSTKSLAFIDAMEKQIQDVSLIKERVKGDLNLEKYLPLRSYIMDSRLDVKLHLEDWKTIFEKPELEELFYQQNLTGEEISMLLYYPYLGEISENEWLFIGRHRELFFNRMSYVKDKNYDLKKLFLPIALQSLVYLPTDEEAFTHRYHDAIRHLDYTTRNYKWISHKVVNRFAEIFCKKGISMTALYQVFQPIFRNTEFGMEHFWSLTDYTLSLPEDELITQAKFESFVSGYIILSKRVTDDVMKSILEKRKDTLHEDFAFLQDYLVIDMPEKMVRRILHKEGNICDILFEPHQDIIKEEIGQLRNYHYSNRYHRLGFIQKIVRDNKKAFLSLFKKFDGFKKYNMNSLLYDDAFYDLVNLNTLNEANLLKMEDMRCHLEQSREQALKALDRKLTFQEFEFVNGCSKFQFNMFLRMNDWKLDDKLRALQTLPNVKWDKEYRMEEEVFLDRLIEAMKEKEFRHFSKYTKKNITKKGALLIFVFQREFAEIMDEIETDSDVHLLLRYERLSGERLADMKERLYKQLPELQDFETFLGASDEFLQNNRPNYYRFYEDGMVKVVMGYKSALNENQKKNLKLLAKAEIAGKLKDIKFREEDFEKEIGYKLTTDQCDIWRKDSLRTTNKHIIRDTSEFGQLIQMGEIPTHTCQSWRNGSYRHCLLSIFDSNKKMVVVEKNGKVIARALLRLTKIAKKGVKESNDLKFVDIEKEIIDGTDTINAPQNSTLVLFLERLYTSITGGELKQIRQEIVDLTKEKAKEMNATLLMAESYKDVEGEVKRSSVQIYISRSKNGNQYLDSFGGEANEGRGGQYYEASVLRLK